MLPLFATLPPRSPQSPVSALRERDAAITRADTAVHAAAPRAAADLDRPIYHYHAPAQWMNDPNGPIFYKGWYHVFYQQHPFGAGSGPKFWGHARSRDLVRWQDLPTALWPSQAQGETEIWSGSVFSQADGKPVAFYASIGPRDPEVWIATPEDDDLIRWRKDPVRITQTIHNGKPLAEWRDPFLFSDFGLTYLAMGGGRDGRGVVGLYQATTPDLRSWLYLGDCFTHPDVDVRNVECPNLFQLDGKWVLLTSVHGRIEAFVGELRNTSFVTEHRGVLADGSYASQIVQATKDRRVELAWVPTDRHQDWNGYLTLPNELHVDKDGTLRCLPVKELAKLYGKETKGADGELDGTRDLLDGDALEIDATILPGNATKVGMRLRSGDLTVAYEPSTRRLTAGDRSTILPEKAVVKGLRLRVFLDRTALDVYTGDGEAALVAHIDHSPTDHRKNVLFSEGGRARVRGVVVHEMLPAFG